MKRGAVARVAAVGCGVVGIVACSQPATPNRTSSSTILVDEPVASPPPKDVRVILFGTRDVDKTKRFRFQPVACALDGKLDTSLRCGELMPAKTRIQLAGGGTLAVERSEKDFVDEAGEATFKAPRGPSCCNYHSCKGDTIPYYAPGPAKDRAIAIWPPTAKVSLAMHAPSAGKGEAGPDRFEVEQLVRVGSAAFAAGRKPKGCRSCGELQYFDGAWKHVATNAVGADGYEVLATTDLDGDQRPEAIVFEVWRNDFGLAFFGNDWGKPLARWSCGNI